MTDAPPAVDAGTLLAELLALPPERRLAHLRAAGDAEHLVVALARETERLAVVEIAEALTASEAVVDLADAAESPCARTEARRALAMVLANAGRFEDALARCDEAVAIASAAGLLVEDARARLASVQPLARLGRYDDAIAAGEGARSTLVAAGEASLAARADLVLGNVYGERADPETALAHFDRARTAFVGDPVHLAHIESNRGVALIELDDFSAAEAAFDTAVKAYASAGLDWAAAIAEGNLAYLATRQGRLERALHHFERTRHLLRRDESPADVARLLAEQADAFALLGMHREALAMYEDVLPDLRDHGAAAEAAQAHAGMGRVLVRLGRFDEADHALSSAAAAFGQLGQPSMRARVDLARAELARVRGQPEEARILAADALETLALRPAAALMARELLARLALEANELGAAERHLAVALPVAEEWDLAPARADLLHLRGLVRRRRGEIDDAMDDLRAAVDQVERVRGALQAEQFRTAFLGGRLAIYEDATIVALDRGGPEAVADAFCLVEQAKGRALLDLVGGALDLAGAAELAELEDAGPAESALLGELARLRAELNWHYSHRDDGDGDGEQPGQSVAERREAIRRLEEELDALQGRLAAARGVAGLFAPPLDLAAALRLVPAGTALVEYFAAEDELLAFVLRDGRARVVRRLAHPDDLADRLRRLQFQLGRALVAGDRALTGPRADRLLADARRELGGLHDLLLAPLRDAVDGAARLTIVPHGPLHALPFHALWDGERHLIERCEVVYAPSASVLAHLGAPDGIPPAAGDALVVGVPDPIAPRIGDEAARVVAALGGDRLLLGSEATAERVAAEARAACVVHLACHGRFDPDSPLGSGLKLADRWLTVRDVYGLKLRASLVTLSGCETGRAAVRGGDELVGLIRGFFVAGASSLILSLWIVNDESATDLMTAFYDAWRRGATKPAALRAAQRDLLARCPHPAFWAPFIIGGQP
jgi:tetratricopeptide (TPR) repeat protein